MEALTFMKTAICAGVMSGRTENGLNLINAVILANDAGVTITQSHEEKSTQPTVKIIVTGETSCTVSG